MSEISVIDRISRKKISEDIEKMKTSTTRSNWYNMLYLKHIYLFFSNTHKIFTGIDQILSHKTWPNKYKRIQSYKICSLTKMEPN